MDAAGDYVSTRLSQLKVGATLRLPIYDAQSARRQLLLAAGCTLTDSQLRALRRRGITSVLVHRSEFERLTSNNQRPLSSEPQGQSSTTTGPAATRASNAPAGWRNDQNSFRRSLKPPAQLERNPTYIAEFDRSYERAAEATSTIVELLVRHQKLDPEEVTGVSQRHLSEITLDLDEFLVRGLLPIIRDYPSRHSLQTAMLACSIGTTMGLSRDELLELGFGCLLHDAGMLLIPEKILSTTGEFTTSQRLEVQKHPMYAANLLNNCREVPQGARHVVYQMHERMNGSGYPRQRGGNQIHQLARIAAVADTYLALVSPRPFRPAMEAYQAIEKVLFSTRQGLFDPSAVRALIHTVSLFPIGSGVKLNDGRVARVIRGNRDQYARPIVEAVSPDAPWESGEVLNLADLPELTVVGTAPLPEPTSAEAALATV